eukprot:TRINITY_DN2487_c0_g2_i2.p1 TRINITY_DN2487_c0_g2~~TRINITY_DN2487_c0_g2_i2.p1  ORF type:complete len:411 (-),score=79.25 TRINITY_DN2487_c0_g2_i2:627-1859(-)
MEIQYTYDLFVIGGGSGGMSAAHEAKKLGARVAVADFVKPSPIGTKWGIGGTCVNVGCIPKKLMHFAALWGESQEAQKNAGWKINEKNEHDWKQLVSMVQMHIKKLNWFYKTDLQEQEIKYYNALASLVDKNTIQLTSADKKVQTVTAKYIIVAVGGRPQFLPEVQNCQELVLTSDDLFSSQKCPGKTLIVGASYIALECAGFLSGLGLDVTVMVRSIFLRGFDQEMANKIASYVEQHHVKFIRDATPYTIEKIENDKRKVTWKSVDEKKNEQLHHEEFDTVMLAIGRVADTKNIGLDKVGVQTSKNGKIICKEDDTTTAQGIFAVGDCVDGRLELTPTAIKAGKLLAQRLFGGAKELMDYVFVPTTVFTPLEYGACGYSEEAAIEKFTALNFNHQTGLFHMKESKIYVL